MFLSVALDVSCWLSFYCNWYCFFDWTL